MIDLDDNTPEITGHAARLRRALQELAGGAVPLGDGQEAAGTRFAHDVGTIGAIIDGWQSALSPAGSALAALTYTQTAALLQQGPT